MSVTNTSGIAGVGYWINQYLRKKGIGSVDKNSQVVKKVYEWVTEQYDNGRITIISDDELAVKTEEFL